MCCGSYSGPAGSARAGASLPQAQAQARWAYRLTFDDGTHQDFRSDVEAYAAIPGAGRRCQLNRVAYQHSDLVRPVRPDPPTPAPEVTP